MKNKKITQDKVVYFVNYILLALFSIAVLYPLIYVVSCSFSSGEALMSGRVKFLPVEPTLLSYKTVFQYDAIWTGYLNSIVYTFVGTVISIILTLFAAYPLSRSDFRGGSILMKLFLFTMMFNGGLVPTYLLVRNLGMGRYDLGGSAAYGSECLQYHSGKNLLPSDDFQRTAGGGGAGRMF